MSDNVETDLSMAFLPGYKHDIFVSYSDNDNQPAIVGDFGWVTNLVTLLKTRLVQFLGSDSVSVLMNCGLRSNATYTTEIMNEATRSAVLLIDPP
jgi:hypothetical protein